MKLARMVLRMVGAVAALFGGAGGATAAAPVENDGERVAPVDPTARFGPARLLGDAGSPTRLAVDPEAFLRERGIDPDAFRMPGRIGDAEITRLASDWGRPPSVAEGSSPYPDPPAAQLAVYGPPPMPMMTPSPAPSPSPTAKPRRRASKSVHGASSGPEPTPTATPVPPAPVYGPPPGPR